MQWFKCLNVDSPTCLKIERELGDLGFGQIMRLIGRMMVNGHESLDVETVKSLIHVKKDRAERLFPLANELFKETVKLYREERKVQKSTENYENVCKSHKISENLSDFDVSNPVSDEPLLEENRLDIEESNLPPNPLKGESEKSPTEKKKKGTVVSSDWMPKPEFEAWLKTNHPTASSEILQTEIGKFKDWCHSKGQTYKDHDAALRNWFNTGFWKKNSNVRSFAVRNYGMAISGENMYTNDDKPVYKSVRGVD